MFCRTSASESAFIDTILTPYRDAWIGIYYAFEIDGDPRTALDPEFGWLWRDRRIRSPYTNWAPEVRRSSYQTFLSFDFVIDLRTHFTFTFTLFTQEPKNPWLTDVTAERGFAGGSRHICGAIRARVSLFFSYYLPSPVQYSTELNDSLTFRMSYVYDYRLMLIKRPTQTSPHRGVPLTAKLRSKWCANHPPRCTSTTQAVAYLRAPGRAPPPPQTPLQSSCLLPNRLLFTPHRTVAVGRVGCAFRRVAFVRCGSMTAQRRTSSAALSLGVISSR